MTSEQQQATWAANTLAGKFFCMACFADLTHVQVGYTVRARCTLGSPYHYQDEEICGRRGLLCMPCAVRQSVVSNRNLARCFEHPPAE